MEEIKGFDLSFKYGGEDTDLTRRLKNNNKKIIIDENIFIYHKTREFLEFLSWCFRRGKAKYHFSKSLTQLFMPSKPPTCLIKTKVSGAKVPMGTLWTTSML